LRNYINYDNKNTFLDELIDFKNRFSFWFRYFFDKIFSKENYSGQIFSKIIALPKVLFLA
jgi:hypothetical protein